ncbi:hypothetical protein C7212DRAFT_161505, partial [Tuber magnatum]
VRLLLEPEDVDPNVFDNKGRPPLSYASLGGHEVQQKLLLEPSSINPSSSDDYGRTPLLYAAMYGHENAVKLLLGYPEC